MFPSQLLPAQGAHAAPVVRINGQCSDDPSFPGHAHLSSQTLGTESLHCCRACAEGVVDRQSQLVVCTVSGYCSDRLMSEWEVRPLQICADQRQCISSTHPVVVKLNSSLSIFAVTLLKMLCRNMGAMPRMVKKRYRVMEARLFTSAC